MATNGRAQTASTFLLGVLVWALTVNYLRGGPPQVKGWLRAKFLNKPMIQGVSK